MKKIFDKNWVIANLELKHDYVLDSVYQNVADKLQRRVEEQLDYVPALAARHDADQSVIEALTGDVVRLKLELARLKAEAQVMSAIGSEEHYAEHIKQMHGTRTEATK
jgi:hypothetical protein